MGTNVAIVDDRDSLVQYSGSWSGAGASEEFAGTTTYSTTQGSTASFTFDGTSITVYGSVAAKTSPTASMTFVIDDSIHGSYTPPTGMTSDVHHEALYASPTLSDGSHTLVITQSDVQADGSGVIYLDYFMWDTASTDVTAYFIDDRDTRIQYEPQWNLFGSDPDFMHTSQGSPGVGATMTFQFEGRGIQFYGGINNGTVPNVMNASMSIDGGPPKFFTPPIQPAAVTTNDLIFDSGPLSDGKHTLVVTAENDVPGSPVWVDYFLVTPPQAAAGSPPPPSTSSKSVSGAASSSSAPSSSTSSAAPSPPSSGAPNTSGNNNSLPSLTGTTPSTKSSASSANDSSASIISTSGTGHKPRVAVTAGAVVGSVVILALLAGIIFFCLRRRKRQEKDVRWPDEAPVPSQATATTEDLLSPPARFIPNRSVPVSVPVANSGTMPPAMAMTMNSSSQSGSPSPVSQSDSYAYDPYHDDANTSPPESRAPSHYASSACGSASASPLIPITPPSHPSDKLANEMRMQPVRRRSVPASEVGSMGAPPPMYTA